MATNLRIGSKLAYDPDKILTLILQMLLLIFLIYMKDHGFLTIFIPVLVIPAILIKELRENKYFWLLLSIILCTFYLILDLVRYVPNHNHIYAYVTIIISLTFFINSKAQHLNFLKIQAKYIIGLCFLFAVIGKFLAPEFLDGSFFDFTNTARFQFFGFSSIVGGIDKGLLQENHNNLYALLATNNTSNFFILNEADKMKNISLFLTYWTILIESLIAISFCLPSRFLLTKYRNVFLLIFIVSTYPIATVVEFGVIVTLLGFIQSLKNNSFGRYSWVYLVIFFILPINNYPFSILFERFFN